LANISSVKRVVKVDCVVNHRTVLKFHLFTSWSPF